MCAVWQSVCREIPMSPQCSERTSWLSKQLSANWLTYSLYWSIAECRACTSTKAQQFPLNQAASKYVWCHFFIKIHELFPTTRNLHKTIYLILITASHHQTKPSVHFSQLWLNSSLNTITVDLEYTTDPCCFYRQDQHHGLLCPGMSELCCYTSMKLLKDKSKHVW